MSIIRALGHSPCPVGLCVVGGGAAGFYAAITSAEKAAARGRPKADVLILEKSEKLLHKVRISGGGRCNVTHRPDASVRGSYPRGSELMEHLALRHSALHAAQWFESKGVGLKTEQDGRVFPQSNRSESIVDCLMSTADSLGIKVLTGARVSSLRRSSDNPEQFCLDVHTETAQNTVLCKRAVLCMGSAQKRSVQSLLQDSGAALHPVAPSLFSFVTSSELEGLQGVSVPDAEVGLLDHPVPRMRGPVLVTHDGLSGPAVLRLSAWGAFVLKATDYKATLTVNWAPHLRSPDDAAQAILAVPSGRSDRPPVRRKQIGEVSPWPGLLPARMWGRLLQKLGEDGAGGAGELRRFAARHRAEALPLASWPWGVFRIPEASEALGAAVWPYLTAHHVPVNGRRTNKEEFVTAGGVELEDLDWERMELRSSPGIHFAGGLYSDPTEDLNVQLDADGTPWIETRGTGVARDMRVERLEEMLGNVKELYAVKYGRDVDTEYDADGTPWTLTQGTGVPRQTPRSNDPLTGIPAMANPRPQEDGAASGSWRPARS